MVKLLVFAILLASSPVSGLLETLFRAENGCYVGCQTNFAATADHLNACRKGCDYQLLNADCATQCKSLSAVEQIQISCQVGCTLNGPAEEPLPGAPIVSIDPVPAPVNPEPERPRSIILIRLRQRPVGELPTMTRFSNVDPMQMFNDMIRRFQMGANNLEQSIDKPAEGELLKGFAQLPSFAGPLEFPRDLPMIRIHGGIRADSSSESSESSEETGVKRPIIDELKHVMQHPREQRQYFHERTSSIRERLHRFVELVRSRWNRLVADQPAIPIWIFLCILLSSSAIVWYMLIALCRNSPSHDALSIRAQELIFHPYDYEGYEKEKIQPNDPHYDVNESWPIKVKLSNI